MRALVDRMLQRIAATLGGGAYNMRLAMQDAFRSSQEAVQRGPQIDVFRDASLRRAAILATFAAGSVPRSIENALRLLSERGADCILVVNGRLSADAIEKLRPYLWCCIQRANVGRDFGAYKTGVQYLQRIAAFPTRLLFINDSVFVDTRRAGAMFEAMFESSAAFVGATENHEPKYHVGSFLFAVSSEVQLSAAWKSFWRTYRPYSGRHHTIRKGEIGMSRALIRRGKFQPQVLYSTYGVSAKMAGWTIGDIVQSLSLLPTELRSDVRNSGIAEIFRGEDSAGASGEWRDARRVSLGGVTDALLSKMEARSQIHWAGALMAKHLGLAIIKKDHAVRGVYGLSEMFQMMACLDYPDMEEVAGEIAKRGSPVSLRGIARVLWRVGFV